MLTTDTEPRRNGWKLSKNFWLYHFECPHCFGVKVHPGLVEALELIGERLGGFRINSAYRCKEKQRMLYEERNLLRRAAGMEELKPPMYSEHCAGMAADINIAIPTDDETYKWLERIGVRRVGHGKTNWTHIGLYKLGFKAYHYDY